MKPERTFIAERALAQHCPELLRGGDPSPEALERGLAALGEPLARALSRGLASLTGNAAPTVSCGDVRKASPAELMMDIAPLAANCLLAAGSPDCALLLSIEAKAVFSLIDRAFGGRGAAPATLPPQFPLSAELLIGKLEAMFSRAFEAALGGGTRIEGLRRDGSLDRLSPFAESEVLSLFSIDVAEEGQAAWRMVIAVPNSSLAALLASRAPLPALDEAEAPLPARDIASESFGGLPLTLRAVLVDMAMPVSVLAMLRPGQVLPISVARSVPIRLGNRTIAHGTAGALDERVAIQITSAFE